MKYNTEEKKLVNMDAIYRIWWTIALPFRTGKNVNAVQTQ